MSITSVLSHVGLLADVEAGLEIYREVNRNSVPPDARRRFSGVRLAADA
jgi:hypothetical protein